MKPKLRIGIIGDYRLDNASHGATNVALQHAGMALGVQVQSNWLPTSDLPAVPAKRSLSSYDGLLCAPGSPFASMDGALAAIRYARENNRVFLGTCGGFQHLVIEFARNVLNVIDAEHAETSPQAPMQFIERLSCSLVEKADRVKIVPGTRLASLMRCAESLEQFWCSFGVNPIYAPCLAGGGLTISALDASDNIRAVELPAHSFFIGTLFIPQLSSTERQPHSVIVGFLRAAAEN
jgi:CTP synthase (UTP-ammonia lyase)